MDADREGRYICQCECGGAVRGVSQFGRLFTWCTRCTPVVEIKLHALPQYVGERT
jgi:hypothetical protein